MYNDSLDDVLGQDNNILGPKGMLGPNYSYADNIPSPSELGIERSANPTKIFKAAAGVNYYSDTMAFGTSSGLARMMKMEQQPMGVRFFVKTNLKCSNGQDMHDYVDTVPRGIQDARFEPVKKALGVDLKGLAPGILQSTVDAMDPRKLFDAVLGTGYPRCKEVELPVGDLNGRTSQTKTAGGQTWTNQWVDGPVQPNGKQKRWVLDKWISRSQYRKEAGMPPLYDGDEGFVGSTGNNVVAGALFAALVLGTAYYLQKK